MTGSREPLTANTASEIRALLLEPRSVAVRVLVGRHFVWSYRDSVGWYPISVAETCLNALNWKCIGLLRSPESLHGR